MDYSPPGFSIHGISQARLLEWVVIFFFRGSSPPRDQTLISCVGRWNLYHWATWGTLYWFTFLLKVYRRRQWHPTPVLLPGESHEWRNLVGCSPWGREESDMKSFTFHFHALEKEMATYSSVLAWKISWTEEPGRLQSMGSQRVRHDWVCTPHDYYHSVSYKLTLIMPQNYHFFFVWRIIKIQTNNFWNLQYSIVDYGLSW